HVVADPLPTLFAYPVMPVQPVNAAVILVIPAARVGRMDDCIMRIVAELVLAAVLFRRREVHGHAAVHGLPGASLIVRDKQAATGEPDNHSVGIHGVNLHGVAFRTLRSSGSEVIAPLRQNGAVVESRHAIPTHSVILALEQPDRTGAG